MNKKTLKILTSICIAILVISFCTSVFAADGKGTTSEGTTFPVTVNPSYNGNFNTLANKIIGIIQALGSFIAVGVLIVLGIKYMMGSASEKAEYKKTMIPYVIGAIFVFGAVNISAVIYKTSQELATETGSITPIVTTIEKA